VSKYLIFGATGGLGSCLVTQLTNDSNQIISISRSHIDFNSEDSIRQTYNLIDFNQPDVIINCAGVLGNNDEDFNKIFNINLRSNWIISNYYIKNFLLKKTVKIIFIGSSSCKSGKKDYVLYASSKAALSNLFEGVSSFFENSKVIFGLVNPTRIDTKMIEHLERNPDLNYLNPNSVATDIINFIANLKQNSILEIDK
jgi:short-subunit dehydrogenase